jgi:hypothetical protein
MAHRNKNKREKRHNTHAVKPANLRPAGMPPKVAPAAPIVAAEAVKPTE